MVKEGFPSKMVIPDDNSNGTMFMHTGKLYLEQGSEDET